MSVIGIEKMFSTLKNNDRDTRKKKIRVIAIHRIYSTLKNRDRDTRIIESE